MFIFLNHSPALSLSSKIQVFFVLEKTQNSSLRINNFNLNFKVFFRSVQIMIRFNNLHRITVNKISTVYKISSVYKIATVYTTHNLHTVLKTMYQNAYYRYIFKLKF